MGEHERNWKGVELIVFIVYMQKKSSKVLKNFKKSKRKVE